MRSDVLAPVMRTLSFFGVMGAMVGALTLGAALQTPRAALDHDHAELMTFVPEATAARLGPAQMSPAKGEKATSKNRETAIAYDPVPASSLLVRERIAQVQPQAQTATPASLF